MRMRVPQIGKRRLRFQMGGVNPLTPGAAAMPTPTVPTGAGIGGIPAGANFGAFNPAMTQAMGGVSPMANPAAQAALAQQAAAANRFRAQGMVPPVGGVNPVPNFGGAMPQPQTGGMLNPALRPAFPAAAGMMRKGGKVSSRKKGGGAVGYNPEAGDTIAKKFRPHPQLGLKSEFPEDLPERPERRARGGSITGPPQKTEADPVARRGARAISSPTPYDYEDRADEAAAVQPAAGTVSPAFPISRTERRARGGIMRRKPPGAMAGPPVKTQADSGFGRRRRPQSVPTPSPYDYEHEEGTAPVIQPDAASVPPGFPPTAAMAKGGKWIQGAIKHPGALHKQLGVPAGKKIPAGKLAKAAKAPGKMGQRARLAETLGRIRGKAKGGECEDMEKKAKGGRVAAQQSRISEFKSAKVKRNSAPPGASHFKSELVERKAAGGAAKERRGFPNTLAPPRPSRMARGGKIRGAGIAKRGTRFEGIY